jgi:hypothetical protein
MVDTTDPLNIPMPGALPREVKPIRERGAKTNALDGILTPTPVPVAPGKTLEQQLVDNNTAAAETQARNDSTSFFDVMKAKFMTETALGTGMRRRVIEDYARSEPADPTFKVSPEELGGFTERDQEWLAGAQSRKDFEMRKWDLQDWNEQQEVSNRKGAVVGFMGSMMAGLPEGVVSGVAAARLVAGLGVGATMFARQGRTGAAMLSNVAENVGGNLAMVGIQSAYDTHISSTDVAFGVGFGVLSSLLSIPNIKGDVAAASTIKHVEDMQTRAATEHMETLTKAQENLGGTGTPEQIKAEATRLEAEQVKQILQPGELPPSRQIMPIDAVETRVDVPEPAEPKAPAQEGPAEAPAAPVAAPEPAAPTFTLPKELAGAKPRWKTADIKFANDVDKALFIVSQSTKSKADAQYREWLKTQGLSDADILKGGKIIRENLKAAEKAHIDEFGQLDTQVSANQAWTVKPFKTWNELGGQMVEHGADINEVRSRMGNPYLDPGIDAERIALGNLPEWGKVISRVTGGEHINANDLLSAASESADRVILSASAAASGKLPHLQKGLSALMHLLPEGHKVVITAGAVGKENGLEMSFGKVHLIAINTSLDRSGMDMMRTAVHELGHAISNSQLRNVPPELLDKLEKSYVKFLQQATSPVNNPIALQTRFSPTASSAKNVSLQTTTYGLSRQELHAEQFVKWVEKNNKEGNTKFFQLPARLVEVWNQMVDRLLALFTTAKAKRLLDPEESFAEFFEKAATGNLNKSLHAGGTKGQLAPAEFDLQSDARSIANDPTAITHGIHLLPLGTKTELAEAKAMLHLYKRADEMAAATKPDEVRLSKLMDTAVFSGGQATANVMARSNNTLVRWIASELLESPGGAQGRRDTASMARHINERAYLGNTLNEVQNAYTQFRKGQGVNAIEDLTGGQTWARFNKMVAAEMESRKAGAVPVQSPAEVKAAADSLEKAYERMRTAQVNAKTVGWASLPETSTGYMPHRMSAEKVINLSMAQKEGLHAALTDQFISIEGWDATFSDALASKYIAQIERRALGGFDAPVGIHQTGAADVVEEALKSMGMAKDQVKATMQKLMASGPGYTKRRIRLDLNQQHTLSDGSTFRLLDIFDTDQFSLLRSQAGRVSGEVALSRHGVFGKAHLNLIREAMTVGDVTNRATARELKAFDQVAAEFLNEPFGSQNKWVDRIMQYNSLARLGGMGFTQAAESINGMVSVGVAKAFASIGSMGRMRKEILALARGEKVDNPLLSSIEKFGGAEFGTDAYKIVFPFDNGSLQHQTYGADTVTMADRLLRGGAHMQGKMSMWRAFHSTQQRGFAEQIVRKSMEFIRDGKNDVTLRDMGISDELAAKIRQELGTITTFQGNRVESVDITKMVDTQAANEYVQAIHRGVSQIIQETFIGEKGAWAHEPIARLCTQFRTFSLTSVEKQWARQRGNIGTAKSLGVIMGAMAIAAPLYIARSYVSSIGRPDQEAYLEQRLSYYRIARATMNYVAATGLAGDLMDASEALVGKDFPDSQGRGGAGSKSFVGNMIAPAVGTVDDAWKAIQNTKEGTSFKELSGVLPGSRIPYLLPAFNALGN